MNNTVLTVWPLLYILVLIDVLPWGYMSILVIRKARLREVESLVQGHPSPIPPNSLHHFKGFCLEVARVTSTHVSLSQPVDSSRWEGQRYHVLGRRRTGLFMDDGLND